MCGDLLDLLDRDRRLAGELARPRERRVEQLVVGDDVVDEAELVAPRRRVIASPTRFISSAFCSPDQARQPLGAAEAGDDPELDLGLAEDRRLGGDPHVAGHRQLAAAAEGERVDGGDRRDAARCRTRAAARGRSSISSLPPASSIFVKALMSAPAEKTTGIEEAITIARTASSALTCSQTVPQVADHLRARSRSSAVGEPGDRDVARGSRA